MVCIVYYRDSRVVIDSRDDWLTAPFRDVQGVLGKRKGKGHYIETREAGADGREHVWHINAGEHFWIWRENQPAPWPCDWMEVLDYLRELGVLGDDQHWAEAMTFEVLKTHGIKYGLNLTNDEFQAVFARMRKDRET